MLIDIDASRPGTLAEQIVGAIQHMVEHRELRPESRLPSIRQFAASHRVSKCTVVQAYDRLAATGHIQSRPGAGFYVRSHTRSAEPCGTRDGGEPTADVMRLMHGATDDFRLEHLSGVGWLPPRWLEDCGLDRAIRRVSRRATRSLLNGYSSPNGYAPLREAIALQLAVLGVSVPTEQILLTLGATGGIDLIGRALVQHGDVVLVDDPGYCQTVGHMRALGATIHGVPWTDTGPDLEALEELARTLSPRLFITTPTVHHPTGGRITQETAFRVLQLAERYDFRIVEDDVLGVLHPDSPTRLAGLDGLNRVIYVNSFSKVLSPRLRVGYVAGCRELMRSLVNLKVFTQAMTSEFAERIVYESARPGTVPQAPDQAPREPVADARLDAARAGIDWNRALRERHSRSVRMGTRSRRDRHEARGRGRGPARHASRTRYHVQPRPEAVLRDPVQCRILSATGDVPTA